MFGAINIGLSGLTAYSRGLQQVSNNVTNLNTQGFKASTVTFSDFVAQEAGGSLSHPDGHGSGNGVNVRDPRLDLRQGDLRQTERDLDLAVSGNGFLVLLKGDDVVYTRTGSFEVDKDGFVVLAGTEYRLATLDASGRPVSLSINTMRTSDPQPTTRIKFEGNLSADAGVIPDSNSVNFRISDVTVYDPSGAAHKWDVEFRKQTDGAPGTWKVRVIDENGATVDTKTLRFNLGKVDPESAQLVFRNDTGLSVTLDFSQNVDSFAAGSLSTLKVASVDGYKTGTLATVLVNADGQLEIGYSNEQKKQIGPIAVADFREPQLLEQRSGGLLVETRDSGRELKESGEPGGGRVLSRRLEASNVDLAQQFGDLILIQRGFQASSQIISVANDMIQQLFGIRGQG